MWMMWVGQQQEEVRTFFFRKSWPAGHLSGFSLAPDAHQEGLQRRLVQLLKGGLDVALDKGGVGSFTSFAPNYNFTKFLQLGLASCNRFGGICPLFAHFYPDDTVCGA
jgi:hypothetical protein